MARQTKKQLDSKLVKECNHLNEIIKKGFPMQTSQGDAIQSFELINNQIVPILKKAA